MGITGWYTARNGQWYGQIADMAAWADPNVTPNKTYTYSVAPVSFHGVPAAYSPAVSLTSRNQSSVLCSGGPTAFRPR